MLTCLRSGVLVVWCYHTTEATRELHATACLQWWRRPVATSSKTYRLTMHHRYWSGEGQTARHMHGMQSFNAAPGLCVSVFTALCTRQTNTLHAMHVPCSQSCALHFQHTCLFPYLEKPKLLAHVIVVTIYIESPVM